MRSPRSLLERHGYLFAVLCIAAATALFHPGRAYFAKAQWALLYLLIIGGVAGLSGVRPALVAAVLAFLAWNYYFLPPYGTFSIHDSKDWLSLFVFLAVAIAMGVQTGRLKEREAEALAREREMALLNEFSAKLVSEASAVDMAETLLNEINRAVNARCVALFLPDETGKLRQFKPSEDMPCQPESDAIVAAEWVYEQSKALGLPEFRHLSGRAPEGWPISVDCSEAGVSAEGHAIFLPLQTAARRQGVLYVGERTDGLPYTVHEARLLVALANQASAFIERQHLNEVAVQADALREADRLKSTLVSSVSHELKTPLASVTATVSNLLEKDVEWDESTARAELEAVQHDLDRLNSSIGSLLDLSRLEAEAWEPKRDWYGFGEVLGTVLSRLPADQRSRVSHSLSDDLPPIQVDFLQWVRVLQNLLENALSYAPAGSPVRVGASLEGEEMRMWVEDEGPGIPPEDRERVFEKFYRATPPVSPGGEGGVAPSGTGLGLAITREIVRFHGGRIWVENVVPHGARFVIALSARADDGGTAQ